LMQVLDDRARMKIVRRLAEMVMKMFVDDGFFHADLHPGNIFFGEDGRINLLDVGMVGRMNRSQTDRFLAYWMALGRRQRDRAFHHLMALAVRLDHADIPGYRKAYERILDEFDGSTVVEKSLARTYFDVVQSGARHGVLFPSEMLLQTKALVTMEALCLFMAPTFRFSDEMRPIVARLAAERAAPAALTERIWTMIPDLVVVGEWFYTERNPRDRAAEPAFRNDAVVALAQAWSDEADAWFGKHRQVRLPTAEDRPHFAALLDLLAQVIALARHDARGEDRKAPRLTGSDATSEKRWAEFREANRAPIPDDEIKDGSAWHSGRPWLDVGPSALRPLARLALARAEAALREHVARRP
jgi:hypothetical protein